MSLDHLKKQAKNAQTLLKEFGVPGNVQLSQGQAFVARLGGYPDWVSACKAAAAKASPKTQSPEGVAADPEFWMMHIHEFVKPPADRSGLPFRSGIRIIRGAMDAIALTFNVLVEFAEKQQRPGPPDEFTVALIACAHASAGSGKSLELCYSGPRRRLSIEIYPLEHAAMLIAGPYAKQDPETSAILATRTGSADMETVLRAMEVSYREMKEALTATYSGHSTQNIVEEITVSIERSHLAESPKSDGDGIWTAEEVRFGRWRLRLLFLPADSSFHFDAFDEAGGTASFTQPTDQTFIRLQASGQWLAGSIDRKADAVRLIGFTKEVTGQLEELAADFGIGLSVEGVRRCSPAQPGFAAAHVRFLTRLRADHPEVLQKGRFA